MPALRTRPYSARRSRSDRVSQRLAFERAKTTEIVHQRRAARPAFSLWRRRPRLTIGSGLLKAALLRFNRPCPTSPAADIPSARTAGMSTSETSTSARSHAASASRTIRTDGNGCADSIRGLIRTNSAAAPRRPLTKPALISRWRSAGFLPDARKPVIRHGATSATGRCGNTPCGNAASGFLLNGRRHAIRH